MRIRQMISIISLVIMICSCGGQPPSEKNIEQQLEDINNNPFDIFYKYRLEGMQKITKELTEEEARAIIPVSYTHLTLPTNREV